MSKNVMSGRCGCGSIFERPLRASAYKVKCPACTEKSKPVIGAGVLQTAFIGVVTRVDVHSHASRNRIFVNDPEGRKHVLVLDQFDIERVRSYPASLRVGAKLNLRRDNDKWSLLSFVIDPPKPEVKVEVTDNAGPVAKALESSVKRVEKEIYPRSLIGPTTSLERMIPRFDIRPTRPPPHAYRTPRGWNLMQVIEQYFQECSSRPYHHLVPVLCESSMQARAIFEDFVHYAERYLRFGFSLGAEQTPRLLYIRELNLKVQFITEQDLRSGLLRGQTCVGPDGDLVTYGM
jgi:hypothetical protein